MELENAAKEGRGEGMKVQKSNCNVNCWGDARRRGLERKWIW